MSEEKVKKEELEQKVGLLHKDPYPQEVHSDDKGKVIAYSLVQSLPQICRGITYRQGWNAFDGTTDIQVVPVRMWRDGEHARHDYENKKNRHSFNLLSQSGEGTYELQLVDGHDFLKTFRIDFNERKSTLESEISRAERMDFQVNGNLSFPGLNSPKRWPKIFRMRMLGSWKETLDELGEQIENNFRDMFGNRKVVTEGDCAAVIANSAIYQDDWGSKIYSHSAIYAMREIGGEVFGRLVERGTRSDRGRDYPNAGHYKYALEEIQEGVLKYMEVKYDPNREEVDRFYSEVREFDIKE